MVLETALETELADHLGYDKGDPAGAGRRTCATATPARRWHASCIWLSRADHRTVAALSAWLTASLIAAIQIAWLQHLAMDGHLARAEPKTLRYRLLHAAARLVCSGRRRHLKVAATWPWAPRS